MCQADRWQFLEGHGPAHFYSTEAPYDLGGRTVTKLGVYAAVHHGGDVAAALAALGLAGPSDDEVWTWVDGLPDVDDVVPALVLPESFWSARPVLGLIRQRARARRVGPDAELAAELAHVLCSIGPHVQLPALVGGRASLNMFFGLVGQTGQGKGTAIAAAGERYPAAPFQTVQPGTGEGLAASFVRPGGKGKPPEQYAETVLFDVAEVGTLEALAERRGTTLEAQLRQLFMGERLGFANASHDRRLSLAPHSYRAALLVGVQPEHAGILLTDGAVTGGTGGRFVWLDGSRDPSRRRGTTYPEPELADWLPPAGWAAYADPMVDSITEPRPDRVVIQLPGVVGAAIDAVRDDGLIDGKFVDLLDRHGILIRIKLSVALMLLDRRDVVTEQDWELAGVMLETSNKVRAYVLDVLTKAAKTKANGVRRGKADDAAAVRKAEHDADDARLSRRVIKHVSGHTEAQYCTWTCIKSMFGSQGPDRDIARHEIIPALVAEGRLIEVSARQSRKGWTMPD